MALHRNGATWTRQFFRLSPDLNEENFFLINRGKLGDRFDPIYHYIVSLHKTRFAFPATKIKHLCSISDGDHSQLPIEHVTDEQNGIRYLRAQDLKDGRIISEKPIYVTREYYDTIPRSHIRPGYFLFSVMASVGSVAVVPDWLEESTANRAIGIIIPKGRDLINPHYLAGFFNTSLGISLFESLKKGGIQQRINLSDLGNLQIPIPPTDIQNKIASILESGFRNKLQKEAEAQVLLESGDTNLLRELGIKMPDKEANTLATRTIKTSFKTVTGSRLDPSPYHPTRMDSIESLKRGEYNTARLRDLVVFTKNIVSKSATGLPYVGLENIESNTGRYLPGDTEEKDFSTASHFSPGSVLFPRLRPYLNKVFYAPFEGVCSIEFFVLNPKYVDGKYLSHFLRSRLVVNQTTYLMTGNTLPRLQTLEVKELLIPVPPIAIQIQLADKIEAIRLETQKLRLAALQEIESAKQEIERIILGE